MAQVERMFQDGDIVVPFLVDEDASEAELQEAVRLAGDAWEQQKSAFQEKSATALAGPVEGGTPSETVQAAGPSQLPQPLQAVSEIPGLPTIPPTGEVSNLLARGAISATGIPLALDAAQAGINLVGDRARATAAQPKETLPPGPIPQAVQGLAEVFANLPTLERGGSVMLEEAFPVTPASTIGGRAAQIALENFPAVVVPYKAATKMVASGVPLLVKYGQTMLDEIAALGTKELAKRSAAVMLPSAVGQAVGENIGGPVGGIVGAVGGGLAGGGGLALRNRMNADLSEASTAREAGRILSDLTTGAEALAGVPQRLGAVEETLQGVDPAFQFNTAQLTQEPFLAQLGGELQKTADVGPRATQVFGDQEVRNYRIINKALGLEVGEEGLGIEVVGRGLTPEMAVSSVQSRMREAIAGFAPPVPPDTLAAAARQAIVTQMGQPAQMAEEASQVLRATVGQIDELFNQIKAKFYAKVPDDSLVNVTAVRDLAARKVPADWWDAVMGAKTAGKDPTGKTVEILDQAGNPFGTAKPLSAKGAALRKPPTLGADKGDYYRASDVPTLIKRVLEEPDQTNMKSVRELRTMVNQAVRQIKTDTAGTGTVASADLGQLRDALDEAIDGSVGGKELWKANEKFARLASKLRSGWAKEFLRGKGGRYETPGEGLGPRLLTGLTPAQQWNELTTAVFEAGQRNARGEFDIPEEALFIPLVNQAERALDSYIKSSYVQALTGPTGAFNSAEAAAWAGKHKAALGQLAPEGSQLRQDLDASRKIAESFDQTIELTREAETAWNNSVAKAFLGADPDVAIKKVFGHEDEAARLREILALTGESQAAKTALRKAYLDRMVQASVSPTPDGLLRAAQVPEMLSGKLKQMLKAHESGVNVLWDPQHKETLYRMADALEALEAARTAKGSPIDMKDKDMAMSLGVALSRGWGVVRGFAHPAYVGAEYALRRIESALSGVKREQLQLLLLDALEDPDKAAALKLLASRQPVQTVARTLARVLTNSTTRANAQFQEWERESRKQ